jgi:hypothetical protein
MENDTFLTRFILPDKPLRRRPHFRLADVTPAREAGNIIPSVFARRIGDIAILARALKAILLLHTYEKTTVLSVDCLSNQAVY